MLIIPPIPARRVRKTTPPAPAATLVLVSANYDETVPLLSLVFDRAIDASLFVAAQVIVSDGSFNMSVYGAGRRSSKRLSASAWRWCGSRMRRWRPPR
jgi:hypothetical protein